MYSEVPEEVLVEEVEFGRDIDTSDHSYAEKTKKRKRLEVENKLYEDTILELKEIRKNTSRMAKSLTEMRR